MQFSNRMILTAPRERVWQALVDVQVVGPCVPGMQELEVYDGGRAFGGQTRIVMGSSSLSFPARVSWVEQNEPHGGRLEAAVTIAGYEIVGAGSVSLLPAQNDSTTLSWQADVLIPEKLAENALVKQMARMFAARFIEQFFHCLQQRLGDV